MSEVKQIEGQLDVKEIPFPWGATNVTNYVGPRVFVSTTAASIVGASGGYYAGTGVFFPFYTYAFTAGLISTSFFGANFALRSARQKDDWINFAVSGSINGGLVGLIKSRRNGMVGLVVGGVGGALYKIVSNSLYLSGREAWIGMRRYTIETSKPRILNVRRPPVDPRHIADVPKDRKFESSPPLQEKPKP